MTETTYATPKTYSARRTFKVNTITRRDMAEAAYLAVELHGTTGWIETLTGHARFNFQGSNKISRVEELIWFLRNKGITYRLLIAPLTISVCF